MKSAAQGAFLYFRIRLSLSETEIHFGNGNRFRKRIAMCNTLAGLPPVVATRRFRRHVGSCKHDQQQKEFDLKAIKERFADLRRGMPSGVRDTELMEMAEQDAEFERKWLEFQYENPRFQSYRLEHDDGSARDPAWLKLQINHPRFLMHRPVPIFELTSAEIDDAVGRNLIADVAAGAASDMAFHHARAGKKSSMDSLGYAHQARAMARALWAAAAVALVAAVVAITFYIS